MQDCTKPGFVPLAMSSGEWDCGSGELCGFCRPERVVVERFDIVFASVVLFVLVWLIFCYFVVHFNFTWF